MKTIKIIAILVLSAFAFYANATVTAKAKISVSTNESADALYLIQGTEYSSAYDNNADAEKLLNKDPLADPDYSINLYAIHGGYDLSIVATDDLADIAIAFQSNEAETQYTLSFSNVSGTITLYDTEEQETITVADGQSYTFSQAVNTTNAARFIINKSAAPADTQELPSSLGTFVSDKKVASVTGAVLYEIIATDGVSNITFQEVNMTNGLAAGTPVLYQKTDATAFVTFTDDAPINGVYAYANGFVGLLPGNNSQEEHMLDGDLWALVSDGKLKFVDTYCTLTPGHAYIDMNAINPQQPAPGRRRLMIGRSGIVTDVENVAAEVKGARKSIENGKIVILKNGQKYNVAGQMMK